MYVTVVVGFLPCLFVIILIAVSLTTMFLKQSDRKKAEICHSSFVKFGKGKVDKNPRMDNSHDYTDEEVLNNDKNKMST